MCVWGSTEDFVKELNSLSTMCQRVSRKKNVMIRKISHRNVCMNMHQERTVIGFVAYVHDEIVQRYGPFGANKQRGEHLRVEGGIKMGAHGGAVQLII